jgi:hypothetical protein
VPSKEGAPFSFVFKTDTKYEYKAAENSMIEACISGKIFI